MKLWVDDVRDAPEGYIWCKSTNSALRLITSDPSAIEEIALDHDAGIYVKEGGDYIYILVELERLSHIRPIYKEYIKNYIFTIHSMNPVGVENMRNIIQRNGWKEVR